MALEIRWTKEAIESYNSIIDYLTLNWSESVVDRFIGRLQKTLKIMRSGKVKFRRSGRKNFHEILITRHIILIYRAYNNRIDLITFWDTRQNPRKKKF